MPGRKYYPDMNAWLVDVRAGFQLGPLLLEGLVAYSTGNSARNNTLGTVRYFQPLTTDTGYQADWGSSITALGIDYLNAFNEAAGRIAYSGNQIGWQLHDELRVRFADEIAAQRPLLKRVLRDALFDDNGVAAGRKPLPAERDRVAGRNLQCLIVRFQNAARVEVRAVAARDRNRLRIGIVAARVRDINARPTGTPR